MAEYPSGSVKLGSSDYRCAFVLTKSDTVPVSGDAANTIGVPMVNAIQVVAAGNIVVKTPAVGTTPAQNTVTITAAPVGSIFNFPIAQLMSTGTSATVIGLVR